jgi:hypothetical protein
MRDRFGLRAARGVSVAVQNRKASSMLAAMILSACRLAFAAAWPLAVPNAAFAPLIQKLSHGFFFIQGLRIADLSQGALRQRVALAGRCGATTTRQATFCTHVVPPLMQDPHTTRQSRPLFAR